MAHTWKPSGLSLAAFSVLGLLLAGMNLFEVNHAGSLKAGIYLFCAAIVALSPGITRAFGSFPAAGLILLTGLPELALSDLLVIGCLVTVLEGVRDFAQFTDVSRTLYRLVSVESSLWAAQIASHLTAGTGWHVLVPVAPVISSLLFLLLCRLFAVLLPCPAAAPLDLTKVPLRAFLPWAFAISYLAAVVYCASLYTGFHAGLITLPLLLVIGAGCRVLLAARDRHQKEIRDLYARSVEALAIAIDAKDCKTNSHVRRVQKYADAIGRQLGLRGADMEALNVAALLHDVGKLAIPEYILLKPGPLTAEEWEKMQTHARVGAQMIERMKFPDAVAEIIKAHHEKWDGTGYPAGLAGPDIPIGARILSAVDCLDALCSDRPYRRALSLEAAMETIRKEAGTSFDPRVVAALGAAYKTLEQLAETAVEGTRPAVLSTSDPIMDAALESRMVQRLAEDLGHALTLDEVSAYLANYLRQTIPLDTMVAFIRRGDRLEPIFASGAHEHLFTRQPFSVSSGPSGWVSRHNAPVLNADPAFEACYRNDSVVVRKLLSMAGVPFEGRNGITGVLAIYDGSCNAFTREHLRILQAASLHTGAAVENALKYHDAESSAETDQLTGLFNARSLPLHLERELSRAARDGSSLAVLVCDLDGFKQVNDRFGHLKGNEALKVFAELMRDGCRESDYLVRMGGDEFVVLQPGIREEVCTPQIERLRAAAIETGWRVCGEECLSISVGAAFFPADGTDAETLLDEADRRMYASKRAHKLIWSHKMAGSAQDSGRVLVSAQAPAA